MVNSRGALIASIILLLTLGAIVVATRNIITAPHPGLNDYMTTWEAARSFWYDGFDPYGPEATLNIQKNIYGRAATASEWPFYFAYPFHTVYVMYPFIHTSYDWASAAWMVALEAALVASMLMICDIFQWKPRPLMLTVLILWTLFFYPSARGFILGQVSHAAFFIQILSLWLITRNKDIPAGVLLALSTFKPQLGVFLIPFLMLWGLRQRRFGLVGGAAVGMIVLLLANFLLLPDWINGWLYQLQLYATYTPIGSPINTVVMALGLGNGVELALMAVLVIGMLFAWYEVLIQDRADLFWWTIAVTFTTTHMVLFRTATPHYVVFIMPLIFYFKWLARRNRLLLMGLLLLTLILPWLHFLLTVEGQWEPAQVYVPLPFAMTLLLWTTRGLWQFNK